MSKEYLTPTRCCLSEEVNVLSDVYEYLVVNVLSSCHFLSDYPEGTGDYNTHKELWNRFKRLWN